MIDIVFTFIISYFILFGSWFIPKAGTEEFEEPTKKELIIIAIAALMPTILVWHLF